MINLGPTTPFAPPLYTSSVYAIPDLDALDDVYEGRSPGYTYARDGHPNGDHLAAKLAALEGGTWGITCGSGMASLSAAFVSLLQTGDTVLASNWLYGGTSKLFNNQLSRFGVKTVSVDLSDLAATRAALAKHRPKVLFAETISNPMCRVLDLAALAELARAAGCRFVVDNTFATPVLCRPLELGADLVMESLTKMIGGHSDVILGFLASTDDSLRAPIAATVSTWGLASSPFGCWQAERGLHTLDLRMKAATANASAVADWLAVQSGIRRVIYPGRPDHPDFALAQRLFPTGCGNMLCFELADRDAVNHFMRTATGIPFIPSLGHASTTISYPAGTSHRFVTSDERERQGITPGLVRVSTGCEPLDQLKHELAKGL